MMENKTKLAQLLLDECCALYLEAAQAAQVDDGIDYGVFPSSAIIVQKDGYHRKFYGLGKPVRTWEYDGIALAELSEPPELSRDDFHKMYFRVARFSFSFPDDMSAARLTMSLGPRYGITWRYSIECTGGTIALGQKEVVCVS